MRLLGLRPLAERLAHRVFSYFRAPDRIAERVRAQVRQRLSKAARTLRTSQG